MIPPHVQPFSSPGDIAPHPGRFWWCWKQRNSTGTALAQYYSKKSFNEKNNLFFVLVTFKILTWPLSEHLAMFSGWSQAGSVESADLDEVMRVWQHILQPSLVNRCGDKYTVCSWFWIVVLPPVLNLQDSQNDCEALS